MLLRSSSTPVLGSLLSSFTESPSNNISTIHPEACHAVLKHHLLPPPTSPLQPHHHHHKLSCTSSPISPSIERQSKGFRRVQSEGNLEDLAYTTTSCINNSNEDRFNYIIDPPPKRYNSGRQRCLTLETIPSFTLSKHTGLRQEEEDEDVESDFEDGEFEEEVRAVERKGYELSTVVDSLSEQVRVKDRLCGEKEEVDSKEMMYLAKGLGVDGIGGCRGGGNGGGGGGDYNSMGSGGNDGDNNHGVEEYYKKMVEENPGNPLFLRNYAQFLYQCKEDREGAEEYYSRAILADPKDGEVLSQYGKLVWEVHQDQERASSYFERAVQASPQDSHVHAAYASFLWDTEDGCDEQQCLPSHIHLGAMATTATYLQVSKEGTSPFTYIIVDSQTTSRTCIHTPGFPPMKPVDLPESSLLSALNEAGIVYFDGRLHETALVVAHEAVKKNIPILMDAERLREGLDDLLKLTDYVVCAAQFPQVWTEASTVPKALVSMLLRLPKVKFVIVTLGKDGCIMLERSANEGPSTEEMDVDKLLESLETRKNGSTYIPTCISSSVTKLRAEGIGTICGRLYVGTAENIPPSELIDTTGAGDAFAGAVLYAICANFAREKMLC